MYKRLYAEIQNEVERRLKQNGVEGEAISPLIRAYLKQLVAQEAWQIEQRLLRHQRRMNIFHVVLAILLALIAHPLMNFLLSNYPHVAGLFR